MFKTISLFICVLLWGQIAMAQPQPIALRMLQGYYANDKLPLDKGVNFYVFSEQRDFEKYFGHIEKEDMPNFEFEHVVVMLTPPIKEQYFLYFRPTAMKAGNFIEIYCSVKHDKHELPYYDRAIAIAAIPKYYAVTKIKFYTDGRKKKLMKSINVSVK